MHPRISEERRQGLAPELVKTIASLDGVPEERLEWLGKLSGNAGQAPRSNDLPVAAAHQMELTAALIDVVVVQQKRIEALEAQVKKSAKK